MRIEKLNTATRRCVSQASIIAIAVTLIACAFSVLLCAPAYAQIVSAGAAQVGAAGNGVPVVNIAAPSAAGVSRNQFGQFDIDKNGAILNNSTSNSLTRLGGWVAGNGQLGPRPARIIVNEVLSSQSSRLNGYLEVAGNGDDEILVAGSSR